MVTAKVVLVAKNIEGDGVRLIFGGDYADGRNKEWAPYTPVITVDMIVTADVATGFKRQGKYTLQFVEEEESDGNATA
jgi:hypothetical protein